MIQAIQRTLAAVLLAGGLLLTGGCATNYSNDLTPELASYGKSEEQDANTYARVIDNNTRTIWDDFARIFFLDKNSRLNPAVVP
ncbi:hypothetical protein [Algisphaera agarilytica]|uniref:Uncharacterized protein n=1 Tax=Algisphaera agarilytica TaxID=1385975 RepID=A0A7X0H9P7_9BACT|nr:hypothetical protein [Algisphaera agarilytica]MBB6430390.1 hypothetical protein [Algisphaera agarilytica]